MSETLHKIRTIKYEVVQLVKKQEKLIHDISTLKQQHISLQGEIKEQLKTIDELKDRNKTLELAKSLKQGEGNQDVKKRIDQMVREIDKCIELLNK
jgi:chromosome segregation ATPase